MNHGLGEAQLVKKINEIHSVVVRRWFVTEEKATDTIE